MTPSFLLLAIDFGYPWWLSYGHLVILIPALLFFLVSIRRGWSRWGQILLGGLLIWSVAALLVARLVLNVNGEGTLPTEHFLTSGNGKVLDLGAGTGRSSIMVLKARPQARLVALDLFADSFDHHFGHSGSPQQRLLENLKIAGVEQRATIETADMRKLPFPPASFDAVVSAYAVDHLGRQGIEECLAETARVLKPGGDFLLMVVANEGWAKFAFGPILAHGGFRGEEWWADQLRGAGFTIREEGTKPLTLFLLARRP